MSDIHTGLRNDPQAAHSADYQEIAVPELGVLRFDPACLEEVRLMLHETLVRDEYLRNGLCLSPGAIVFDVGANIGIFALHVQRCCAGECTVFAFEPIPETYALLQWNTARNCRSSTTYRLFDFGLTSLEGPNEAEFTTYPGLSSNATTIPERKAVEFRAIREAYLALVARREPENLEVRAAQVRERFARIETSATRRCRVEPLCRVISEERVPRIDLLKIDVEGAESLVLHGLDELSWALVQQVVVEAASLAEAAELESLIRAHGFRWTQVDQPAWAAELGLPISLVQGRRTP